MCRLSERNAALADVFPLMRWMAARMSRTPADADDLASEGAVDFLRAWEHLYDGEHPRAFAKFMVLRARQRLERQRRRHSAATLDDAEEPPARDHGDPAADRADEAARLRAAVGSLPDRRREFITARFGLDGDPPRMLKELAGGLGVSKQAMEYHQRLALAELAAALDPTTHEDNDHGA
ncbi:MAG TPA: sigma-70 family RNA polymerase sigma factor [Urbifossiella sp.]|nr:sigma-70 family RNA polymerase sigma factor [Urbifossiella sp.]